MNIETWKLEDIKPYENNPKLHNVEWIAKSIQEFKIDQPIVVDGQGVIIKGHGRLKAAQSLGLKEFPVVVRTDLTPEQVRIARIADNRTNEGGWDSDLLSAELSDIIGNLPEFDFASLGINNDWFSSLELPDLLGGQTNPTLDDEAADIIPEVEEEPIMKLGELWQLGDHRLLCGDATKREDVTLLLCGATPELSFTDPPYNMNYQDVAGNFKKIANDKMPDDDFIKFLSTSLIPLPKQSYICCNWMYYHLFKKAIENTGKEIKACIVWDKITRVQNLDKYFKQHEFILYTGKLGGGRNFKRRCLAIATTA